jgi:hypothetical protein
MFTLIQRLLKNVCSRNLMNPSPVRSKKRAYSAVTIAMQLERSYFIFVISTSAFVIPGQSDAIAIDWE